MKELGFWRYKLARRAIQWVGGNFYQNPDPALHKSIFVAGTARSGTTWLGDLIAAQLPSRILFEPFNPHRVPAYRNFHYFQYMRPDADHSALHAFAHGVLTGKIRNRWVDRQNERLFAEFRLIKEIRANLMLKWLEAYCRAHNVKDGKVWQAIYRQIWLYDHPARQRMPGMDRKIIRWAKNGF